MSQGYSDPQGFGPPPPQKSSNTKWIFIILALVLGLPLLCCGGCIVLGMFGMSAGAREIANQVQNTQPVQQHIGTINSASMNLMATADEQQKQNDQDLAVIDIKGDKGNGILIIHTASPGSNRPFDSATLRLPDGQEFPLQP